MSKLNNLLRYYFYAGLVEGLICLGWLLLIPGDPKNAWLFGFSKIRLALAAGMLILTMGLAWLVILARRDAWLDKITRRFAPFLALHRWYFPAILLAWGLAPLWLYFDLRIVFSNLTTLQGILTRLSPFFLLAGLRWVQAVVVSALALRTIQPVDTSPREVLITPARITFILASLTFLLVLISASIDTLEHLTWDQKFFGFRVKLDLDQEANIPTFFSTMLLSFLALLLWAAGQARRTEQFARHWAVLSFLFIVLAIDETSVLHEKLIEPVRALLHTSGGFYFAWVVPAIPVVILFSIAYARWFLHLPPETRRGFLIGFVLYLIGVIGFEILGGAYADIIEEDTPVYNVITTLEEATEMTGLVILIHTALQYLADHIQTLALRFSRPSR